MGPGDVPKYPKEVSTKKMTLKNLNLKKLHRISENPSNMKNVDPKNCLRRVGYFSFWEVKGRFSKCGAEEKFQALVNMNLKSS